MYLVFLYISCYIFGLLFGQCKSMRIAAKHFIFGAPRVRFFKMFDSHSFTHGVDLDGTGPLLYTVYRAGHATTLPRQRDHVFMPQSCWILHFYFYYCIFVASSSSRNRDLNIFPIFSCPCRLYYSVALSCCRAAKRNGRVDCTQYPPLYLPITNDSDPLLNGAD